MFAGSNPENYDRYLVPLIFQDFAGDLAKQVASLSPKTVLETAAGSGVVTRALIEKLPPDARYIVTDLNQPMLDYAVTRQPNDEAHHLAQGRRTGAALPIMPPSMSFAASLAPVLPGPRIGLPARRGGCSKPSGVSCSMSGIVSKRMCSLSERDQSSCGGVSERPAALVTRTPPRLQRYCHHPESARTAVFPHSGPSPELCRAAHRLHVIRPLLTVRAHHYAMRSRREMPRN